MKTLRLLVGLGAASLATLSLVAEIETPRVSLKSEVSQTIGFSEVTIVYSRPNDNGRQVFGGMVKNGQVWRTGANEATTIELDSDATIGGHAIAKGRYGLFTIPGDDAWTIILNTVPDQWGAFNYDASKDLFRFEAPARKSEEHAETFGIQFVNANFNRADIELRWEDVVVSFPIEVSEESIDARTQASIERDIIQGAERTWASYADAARYYIAKGKDLETALEWFEKSNELNPNAYWLIHDKAQLLAKLGRKEEAIAAANASTAAAQKAGAGGFKQTNDAFISSLK